MNGKPELKRAYHILYRRLTRLGVLEFDIVDLRPGLAILQVGRQGDVVEHGLAFVVFAGGFEHGVDLRRQSPQRLHGTSVHLRQVSGRLEGLLRSL